MPNPAVGSAAASVGGALISSRGSRSAGRAQAKAAESAAEAQLEQYYQTREDMAPWRQAGEIALRQQMALMGLSMPESTPDGELGSIDESGRPVYNPPSVSGSLGSIPGGLASSSLGGLALGSAARAAYDQDYERRLAEWEASQQSSSQGLTIDGRTGEVLSPTELFRQTPGYQFALDQGIKALDRSASARGLLHSGAQQKALADYATGLADLQFDKYFNRLGVLSGTGQTANTSLGAFGAQAAGLAGQFGMAAGQANAANAINQSNIGANLINQGAQLYAMRNFNPTGQGQPGLSGFQPAGNGTYSMGSLDSGTLYDLGG